MFLDQILILFCNNVLVFIVIWNQFNVPLLNKIINLYKKKSYWPQTFER